MTKIESLEDLVADAARRYLTARSALLSCTVNSKRRDLEAAARAFVEAANIFDANVTPEVMLDMANALSDEQRNVNTALTGNF